MKTITTLLATAALIGGVSVASAQQTPSQKMDEQAGGNNRRSAQSERRTSRLEDQLLPHRGSGRHAVRQPRQRKEAG